MQVEVVRHDGGTQDADGDVELILAGDGRGAGQESRGDPREVGTRNDQLEEKAPRDADDESDYEGLEETEALVLEIEDDQHVERRDDDAEGDRDAEEQVEPDGRTDDLGQVAGGDGDLTEDPEEDHGGARVVIAARLREVPAGDDPQLGGQPLQEDGHQVRDQDDGEQ